MSLEVRVKKRFERFELDVAFETGEGLLGLLGSSGCGKSVTLKCIAGLITPDEGRIVLDGNVLFDSERGINLPPQKRRVGYLFQHYALFPNMTVEQNIAAGARDKSGRREKINALVSAFRLEGQEKKYPRQLSGGQQQRVALARILASEPAALLLDEPFSALDSYLKWQVELEMGDRLALFPGSAVFVTHSREEVYRLCCQVCVLSGGKAEPVQGVRELFESPVTLPACLLTGCKNVSRARPAEGGKVEAVDWGVTLEPGQALPSGLGFVGVRSHHINPCPAPGDSIIPCKVERVIEDVFSTVVMLSTPGGKEGYSLLRLELSKADWAVLGGPDTLNVGIQPRSLMLLR